MNFKKMVIEYDGRKNTIEQWATELNLPPGLIWERIKQGWDFDKALSEPAEISKNVLTYNGKTQSLADWAREVGINRRTLITRKDLGWSPEKFFLLLCLLR